MSNTQNQMLTRQEFGSTQDLATAADIAVQSAAAQAKAMVESRYIMAMRNPRNWDQVRQDLTKECSRPTFAHNKSALYKKPIGKGIEGLGIRFVEVAFRCMKNVLIEVSTVYDDAEKEIMRITVTDLESNVSYPMDARVTKTVERSKPLDDGSYISTRKNSYGKQVYTIPGTDDELLNKRGAMVSKAVRTLGLRIIPGDLQDEAEAIIRKIRLDKAAQDPDEERRNIIDAFGALNIKSVDLASYLGHDIDQCAPIQLVELRGLYGAIRDGETSWPSVMENKRQKEEDSSGGAADLNEGLKGKPTTKKKAAKAKKETATAPKTEKATGNTKGGAKDAQAPAGPTYAGIMDDINKATTSDQIEDALTLIDHLPEEQQAEIQAAAGQALEILDQG